jgi:hypothetical protein
MDMFKTHSVGLILAVFVAALIAVVEIPNIFENVLAQQPEGERGGGADRVPGGGDDPRDRENGADRDRAPDGNPRGSDSERVGEGDPRSGADTIPDSYPRSDSERVGEGDPRENGADRAPDGDPRDDGTETPLT